MSGGSFDYLCSKEDPGLSEVIEDMIAELEALARDGVPGAAEAAAETRIVRAEALTRMNDAWGSATAAQNLRDVWHDVEWWRSCDYDIDQVREGLARFAHALASQSPPVEVVYRNHRGETAIRHVRPLRAWFGATEHHTQPQWLLEVWDLDRHASRTYALAECDFMGAKG